jgi:hypothetical protein
MVALTNYLSKKDLPDQLPAEERSRRRMSSRRTMSLLTILQKNELPNELPQEDGCPDKLSLEQYPRPTISRETISLTNILQKNSLPTHYLSKDDLDINSSRDFSPGI